MLQRILWVSVCALAVLGAFLMVTQAFWMLGIGTDKPAAWLPYVAGGVGALMAGANARYAVEPKRPYDSALGALVAVAALILIGLVYPRGFTWSPLNSSSTPALTVPLGVVVMVAGGFVGGWIARPLANANGVIATAMFVSFVTRRSS